MHPYLRRTRTRPRSHRTVAALVLATLTVLAGCSSSGSGGVKSSSPAAPDTSSTTPGTAVGVALSSAPTSAPSGSASTGAAAGPKVVHQKLTNFRIVDVTFVGSQAWALGRADCLSGSGTCDAIEYSGDGGRTWRSAPAPGAGIAAPDPRCIACVDHIRFATSRIGYAYGVDTFFTTTDGGNTWVHRSGSAEGLETLDGNVIRVRAGTPGCPPGCSYYVQTAAIGSTTWHRVSLPGEEPQGVSAALVRTHGHAYLQVYAHSAGGAPRTTSVLWSSTDNGQSWINRGEVCPQIGSKEVDGTLLSAAPGGGVAVLCTTRPDAEPAFVVTSSDGGAHFRAASTSALGAVPEVLGAGSARLLLVSSDDTYRSTDGGSRFVRLAADAGSSPGQLSYLGFASVGVVHGVSTDGRSLWTSTNAGVTWTSHRFT